jgi:hypothetical protein
VPFAKQGVMLVTINYRLGRLAFFAFPAIREHPEEVKGNYAYMHQIARPSGGCGEQLYGGYRRSDARTPHDSLGNQRCGAARIDRVVIMAKAGDGG